MIKINEPSYAAGKVYNVTAYFEYHPGGIPELERGIGKEATSLFDEVSRACDIFYVQPRFKGIQFSHVKYILIL